MRSFGLFEEPGVSTLRIFIQTQLNMKQLTLTLSLISVFFLFVSFSAKSQDTAEELSLLTAMKIDSERDECLSLRGDSKLAAIECELTRDRKWSKTLESAYDELMTLLEQEQKDLLYRQQADWLEYRKNTVAFNENYYAGLDPDKLVRIAELKGDLTRDRALQLITYLQDYRKSKLDGKQDDK